MLGLQPNHIHRIALCLPFVKGGVVTSLVTWYSTGMPRIIASKEFKLRRRAYINKDDFAIIEDRHSANGCFGIIKLSYLMELLYLAGNRDAARGIAMTLEDVKNRITVARRGAYLKGKAKN